MRARKQGTLFQHRYYRINKMLLQLTGQWPYQSTLTRSVHFVLILLILGSIFIPLVIATVKHIDDWYMFIECLLPLTFSGICFTKMCLSTLNSKKMLRLLNRMSMDWEIFARNRYVNSLHEYTEMARRKMIVYTVVGYTTGVFFAIQPAVPKIIDILLRNGTEPGEFPIPVDYAVIDAQKYYFYFFLQYCVALYIAMSITIACDSLFMVYVHHGCGLYAALGQKLERIRINKRSNESNEMAYRLDELCMDVKDLASCIDRHNHVIEHAKLIEKIYSWSIFLTVGLNSVLIAISGFEIIIRTIEPHKTLRFVFCYVIGVGHLFVQCYMGQILMDHSISIRYDIFNSEWYTLPAKAQAILLLMTIRCNVPCKITAGRILIMSMEKFNTILKTSMSFFMVLRSI